MSTGKFQRWILPGFAFKAVVIGGGYATGRELAEFFLPCGLWGGLWGMCASMLIWSATCTVTFAFAWNSRSHDYRSFFRQLLGPAWPAFEIAYLTLLLLVLSVFGAAAGEIVTALTGAPSMAGTLLLMGAIAIALWHGNESVEKVFKYVSAFLYLVYALFLALCLTRFGADILANFTRVGEFDSGWLRAGVSYAGYNVAGAVAILPVVRHMRSRRDAFIAGALCGPLAMVPAFVFFICMSAFYPDIAASVLPSDWLLTRLGIPAFRVLFQVMILLALLESGAGCLNSLNERIASTYAERGKRLPPHLRIGLSLLVMTIAIFVANRFGLIELIARGYRVLTVIFICVYLAPLLTRGLWRVLRAPVARPPEGRVVANN